MAAYKFTTNLNRVLRKFKLSVKEKAFADLLIMGWDPMDAYTTVELYNPLHTLETNYFEQEKLRTENSSFVAYYNDRIKQLNNTNKPKTSDPDDNLDYTNKYRDKDEIISALAKEADSVIGKERIDALNKIADLQRMKQEENKTEEERVMFYLPLTCYNCPLYKAEQNSPS